MVLVAGCSWAPRGRSCARREARGRLRLFALCAREGCDRFQCLLRPGPAAASAGYVPLAVWGQAPWDCDVLLVLAGCSWAPRGRSCARREARRRLRLFALCARERCDRFQCLLRPGPAAALVGCVPWVIGGTGCGGGGSGGAADFQWKASDPNDQSRVLGTRMNRNSLAQSSRKETTNR